MTESVFPSNVLSALHDTVRKQMPQGRPNNAWQLIYWSTLAPIDDQVRQIILPIKTVLPLYFWRSWNENVDD